MSAPRAQWNPNWQFQPSFMETLFGTGPPPTLFQPAVFQYPLPTPVQTEQTTPTQTQEVQGPTSARTSNSGSCRPNNWTPQEDVALCKAWLKVSQDPIVGTGQRKRALWARIYDEFVKFESNTERNSSGLQNRWGTIRPLVSKLTACVKMIIDNGSPSGFNYEDQVFAIRELFNHQHGQYFKHESCWHILKACPTWSVHSQPRQGNTNTSQTNSQTRPVAVPTETEDSIPIHPTFQSNNDSSATPLADEVRSSTPRSVTPIPFSLDDDDTPIDDTFGQVLERPPGRKSAKNQRQRKRGSSTEGSSSVADKIVAGFAHMAASSDSRWDKYTAEKDSNMNFVTKKMKLNMYKMAVTTEAVKAEKELFGMDESSEWYKQRKKRIDDMWSEVDELSALASQPSRVDSSNTTINAGTGGRTAGGRRNSDP